VAQAVSSGHPSVAVVPLIQPSARSLANASVTYREDDIDYFSLNSTFTIGGKTWAPCSDAVC
jgi:hypothetical protein